MPSTAKIDDRAAAKREALPDKTHNQPTQAEYLQYIARHKFIEDQMASLRKKKNLMRREMKNAGIDCQTFDAIRRLHALGDDAVEDNMRNQVRYLRFMNMPVGSQMTFLDEERPDTISPDIVQKAFTDGLTSGMMGGNFDDNPHELNTDAGQEWQKGYNEGQAVLKQELLDHNASLAV